MFGSNPAVGKLVAPVTKFQAPPTRHGWQANEHFDF